MDIKAESNALAATNTSSVTNIRILLPTVKDSDAATSEQVNFVLQTVKNEKDLFPLPEPKLSEIEAANTDFLNSIKSEEFRSKITDKATADKRVFVLTLFSQLAIYVLSVAKGDTNIVDRSGFKRAKPPKRPSLNKEPLTPVIGRSATGKATGAVDLTINNGTGARLYLIEIESEPGKWTLKDAFNNLKFTVNDLPEGYVSLRVWGKTGKMRSAQPSNPVTVRVL